MTQNHILERLQRESTIEDSIKTLIDTMTSIEQNL